MIRKRTVSDFAQWAALPMAHTSKVEGRIKMVLDTTRRRTSPRRFLLLATVAGAVILVPLSMLRPAAQAAPVPATPPAAQQGQSSGGPPFNWALERQYALENGRFMGGQALSPSGALVLEQQIAAEPNDYAAHLRLLGYGLNGWFQSKPATRTSALAAYRQQLFWLIQNHPESLLFSREYLYVPRLRAQGAFEGDRALWQEQFAEHPNSALILGNAAGYYTISDKALVKEYLLRAQALEPQDPEWHERLAEAYLLRGPHPSAAADDEALKRAFAEYETAARLTKGTLRTEKLTELASLAFTVGEYDKARQYANALLMRGEQVAAAGKVDPRVLAFTFPQSDDDIHEANSVLGRLSLHDGDIAGAEAHLLAMGHVSNSRTLDAAGPNMQLAQDLLERGDRAPVLAYLDECAKFWHDKQLGVWRSQIQQGQIPDFRRNLHG